MLRPLEIAKLLLVTVALATLTPVIQADYIAKSILCDDIPAICEFNKLEYDADNKTICGDRQRFLNPKVCNCGHKCIEYLVEGSPCVVSSPFTFPSTLCGSGLECLSNNPDQSNAKCSRNPKKPCINETLQYEEDTASGQVGPGQYRPNCDEYGRYAGRQCSPGSTCYCVNPEGKRLFGEAPSTQKANMTCACAKYWDETEARGINQGLRCLSNGDFDPLICVDKVCYCYDTVKETVDGPYPISIITELKCYDRQIHNENYINKCHKDQMDFDSIGGNSSIVIGERGRPICNRDGYYAPIQRIGPRAYCVDPMGEVIDNFSQCLENAKHMTCNCARRRALMEANGQGASKPKCCDDGEFFPWQTRGLLAYCVDQNGNQYGDAKAITDVMNLSCHSDDPCVNSASTCLI